MNSLLLRFFFLALALVLGAGESAAAQKEAAVKAEVAQVSQASGSRKDGKANETCFSIPQQAAIVGGEQAAGGGASSEDRNQKTKRQKRQHNTHYSSSCSVVNGKNDESKSLFTAYRTQNLSNRDAQQERTKTIRFLHLAAGID